MPESEFLLESEVAALLRHSVFTLRNWRQRKKGPPWVKAGGKVLYPSRNLAAWIKKQTTGGDTEA